MRTVQGRPRARPRAPRGSPGRGGSWARRERGSSRPRRRERERKAPSLAPGQGRDGSFVHVPAGEQEPAEQHLRLRPSQSGRGDRAVEHGPVSRKLLRVLREVRRDDAVAQARDIPVRRAAAQERFEQGGLTGSVRADERDLLATLEDDARIVQQRLVAGRERDVLGVEDDAPCSRRVEEVEAEGPPTLGQRRERPTRGGPVFFEPADLGQLGLRLAGLGFLVPEALDEAFEPRDVLRDAIRGLLRGRGSPAFSRATRARAPQRSVRLRAPARAPLW